MSGSQPLERPPALRPKVSPFGMWRGSVTVSAISALNCHNYHDCSALYTRYMMRVDSARPPYG
jgi:hypothetical protein